MCTVDICIHIFYLHHDFKYFDRYQTKSIKSLTTNKKGMAVMVTKIIAIVIDQILTINFFFINELFLTILSCKKPIMLSQVSLTATSDLSSVNDDINNDDKLFLSIF